MFNFKFKSNKRNEIFKERVSDRRERMEEMPNTTLIRFEKNRREIVFKFTGDIRRNNGFSRNDSGDNKRKRFKRK